MWLFYFSGVLSLVESALECEKSERVSRVQTERIHENEKFIMMCLPHGLKGCAIVRRSSDDVMSEWLCIEMSE